MSNIIKHLYKISNQYAQYNYTTSVLGDCLNDEKDK